MTRKTSPRRRARWLPVLAVLAALASGPPAVAADARALDILLTNDDGFDAPGIRALQAALQGAGHRVTLIAPRVNQSGSSERISTGPVAYREEAPGVWAVDGSPADAVAVGLAVIRPGPPPDLVISGANLGQNVGATANVSGTVGAALMAEYLGVPAIAVSVGLDFAEHEAAPRPYPSTLATFPAAAAFTTDLVAALAAAAADGPLLPPDAVLNVNYPLAADGPPRGVRFAENGRYGGFAFDYVPTGRPGEVRLAFAPEDGPEPDPRADTTLFAQGYVTITVLDGELAAAAAPESVVAERLAGWLGGR